MDENEQFAPPPAETTSNSSLYADSAFISASLFDMPAGNHEQPPAVSSNPPDHAAFIATAPPSFYDSVYGTAARSDGVAKASLALGLMALFFLSFWLFYPPAALIMTLLSLAISLIGLRLARQARRKTPSNLADAGYMINAVGLVAASAFCLLGVAACVGLAGLITALL